MALDVSGSDADSYITLADANTYATNHFLAADLTTWNAASDAVKEAALRQATQFIDARYLGRFKGEIQSQTQALEWPRHGVYDRSGRYVNGIPTVVKNATVELAKSRVVGAVDLAPDEARGGMVKREKVDVVEIEYMDGAPAGTDYRFVDMILKPVLNNSAGRVVRT